MRFCSFAFVVSVSLEGPLQQTLELFSIINSNLSFVYGFILGARREATTPGAIVNIQLFGFK